MSPSHPPGTHACWRGVTFAAALTAMLLPSWSGARADDALDMGVQPLPGTAAAPIWEQAHRQPPLAGAAPAAGVEQTAGAGGNDTPNKVNLLRVRGRFGYTLPDGRFVPAFNVKVVVYHETPTWQGGCSWHSRSAQQTNPDGRTDADGYFDFTVDTDVYCLFCEGDPNVFVSFVMMYYVDAPPPYSASLIAGTIFHQSAACGDEYTFFETPTFYDVAGPELNLGTLVPSSEAGNATVHAFLNAARSAEWLRAHGVDQPVYARLQAGAGRSTVESFADNRVFLFQNDWWKDYVVGQLAGQLWLGRSNPPLTLLYCNGICDSSTCGACLWCPENANVALWEGAGSWIGHSITAQYAATPGHVLWDRGNIDALQDCFVAPQDAPTTPGLFAAALRDLADPDFDDHPTYPGRDRGNWGEAEILQVLDDSNATSPLGFFAAYKAAFPARCPQIWETARNCGYDLDSGPPGAPTGLTSPTHTVGVSSPDATVDLQWTVPVEDCSGISGYSVRVGASAALPDAVAEIANVTAYTTGVLSPGSWYITLRAVDTSGRWSSGYATFGPVIIRNPIPANVAWPGRAGWADPVVPRPTANSTATIVPAPVSLTGNTKSTYWNAVFKNVGDVSTGTGFSVWAMADGAGFYNPVDPVQHAYASPALAGMAEHTGAINLGPLQVSGGRHAFGAIADFTGLVAELSETDNNWARQWIWSPWSLATNGSVFRFSPPARYGAYEYTVGSPWYYNCDGLRFQSSGWWNALTLTITSDDVDWDLRLHAASTGPSNGFAGNVGWSSRPAACLDAVFVNRNNTSGSAQPWDVGVIQTQDSSQLSSYTARHVTSVEQSYGDSVAVTLASQHAMLLREFYVSAADLGWTSLAVRILDDSGPVHLMWLHEGFVTGAMDDGEASTVTDEHGYGHLEVQIVDAGYHCLVIYRDPKDGPLNVPIPMTVEIGRTPPDFRPHQPAGWAGALVPRRFADGTPGSVPTPTTLLGWAGSTWLNFATINDSPVAVGTAVQHAVRLDGATLVPFSRSTYLAHEAATVNMASPVNVRGGRHTLGMGTDTPDNYEEISERNNGHARQWIWSPLALAQGPLLGRPQPPDPYGGWEDLTGTAIAFNADGYRIPDPALVGAPSHWAGLALVPGPTSDVDLRLHAASAGPDDGFLTPLATSEVPERGGIDFVLLDFTTLPAADYDAGAVSRAGTEGYRLELVTSNYLDSKPSGAYGPFTLAANQLLDLHEFDANPGFLRVRLINMTAGADLGISLHAGGVGALGRADVVESGAAWLAPAGEDEWMIAELPSPDVYCLAVWKRSDAEATLNVQYRLDFLTVTDAPAALAPSRTALAGNYPNPFNPRTSIRFDTVREGRVQLTVFSQRGCLVRHLLDATNPAGRHEVVWDGTDDGGQPVATGVYMVQLSAAGVRDRHKVLLLK